MVDGVEVATFRSVAQQRLWVETCGRLQQCGEDHGPKVKGDHGRAKGEYIKITIDMG